MAVQSCLFCFSTLSVPANLKYLFYFSNKTPATAICSCPLLGLRPIVHPIGLLPLHMTLLFQLLNTSSQEPPQIRNREFPSNSTQAESGPKGVIFTSNLLRKHFNLSVLGCDITFPGFPETHCSLFS